ncbi:Sphingomyelin phosphodiesterase [Lamellibrachia satsuma]|nr:Sphingomyelin phosphodiesterase [Lamellibrachia satsuma]
MVSPTTPGCHCGEPRNPRLSLWSALQPQVVTVVSPTTPGCHCGQPYNPRLSLWSAPQPQVVTGVSPTTPGCHYGEPHNPRLLLWSAPQPQVVTVVSPTTPGCHCGQPHNPRLLLGYENTVVAQFFGHTHFDHLEIFYDTATLKRALSVAYIGPSVTTYEQLNPGYRVYTVEGQHPTSGWAVLDHETYIMNLTEANLSNKPRWIKEYSAKATYNLSSLMPTDWDDLVQRMHSDDATLQTFYRLYWKSHSPTPTCDNDCKHQYLCEIRTGRSHDPQMCRHLNVTISEAMLYRKAKTFC